MPPKRKASAMAASKPAAGAKKKAYGMAPVMPVGEVLTDFNKKQWVLGKSFASGGFGRIYYAKLVDFKTTKENYVIKMEPAENGPLFQEFHIYTRIGKPEIIEKYKISKGLKFLGIPAFYGCGSHKKDGLVHRFLVLPRLGTDLEKIRESQPSKRFSKVADVGRLILTCLDSYEYLHSLNTVHADLKGENLLLSPDCASPAPSNIQKCFLVDYGLARKVPENPSYKEQPKKAHDGTLIFTSIDAHKGCAPVYRGDVEILGYNLIFWLHGSLPWLDKKPEQVLAAKSSLASNPKETLRAIFGTEFNKLLIDNLAEFFDVCFSTDYASRPNYNKLRTIANAIIKSNPTRSPPKQPVKPVNRTPLVTEDESTEEDDEILVPESPPIFKVPASPRPRVLVPGVANLGPKTRSAPAPRPAIKPRRRESVEAALVKKYRKYQPCAKKVVREMVAESEDEGENSEMSSKNVGTQTSPGISAKWLASRPRRCLL